MYGWMENRCKEKQEVAGENQEDKERMEVSEGVDVEVEVSPLLL